MRGLLRILARGLVWSFAFVFIVAVAGGLGVGLLSLRAADGSNTAEPLPVSVVTVRAQDRYIATRRFSGRIEAAEVSDVGFQVAGKVAEVLVKIGDRVEKDDIVARLDPARLKDRLDELAAARALCWGDCSALS